jgi:[NiFe] hydrogenase diaphorase moiety large subunit
LLVNGRAIPRADRERLALIRELILERRPLEAWPDELFEIADNVRRRHVLLGSNLRPGEAMRAALERGAAVERELAANERSWREGIPQESAGPEAMLREIERSGLRVQGPLNASLQATDFRCEAHDVFHADADASPRFRNSATAST